MTPALPKLPITEVASVLLAASLVWLSALVQHSSLVIALRLSAAPVGRASDRALVANPIRCTNFPL